MLSQQQQQPSNGKSNLNEGAGAIAGWKRWRRLWPGWIVIPTGIGLSVFTVLQWKRISWNVQSKSTNPGKNFHVTCYRAIPLRAMSRAWGWISSQHVPLKIRVWLYSSYANLYGVNLQEAAHSLEHYSSLCEFFIRPLKKGTRPVAQFEPIVSPADGCIINASLVTSCNVEQIKGVTYTIKTFLGEPSWRDVKDEHNDGDDDEQKCTNNLLLSSNSTTTKIEQQEYQLISQCDKVGNIIGHQNWKYPTWIGNRGSNRLEDDGCDLIQLSNLNTADNYKFANKISANFRFGDSKTLGWLVFYLRFCIKDLLINSFYFGFQIIYGIKSTIVLSNGKMLKGASLLRSHFSLSSTNGSSVPIFEAQLDASTSGHVTSSTNDEDSNFSSKHKGEGDESNRYCFDPDWKEYKRKLLHNPAENELYQLVVYLAPGDYHRFHSPADLKIKFRRHFQGELLSVNPKIARWIPELFSLNERAVYVGEWQHGFFSMAAVGATNVGSIRVHSDKELLTNTRRWKNSPRFKDKFLSTEWKKGEEIGEFRMGSTIVLLFEAPKNFLFNVQPGDRIKVGEPVTESKTCEITDKAAMTS